MFCMVALLLVLNGSAFSAQAQENKDKSEKSSAENQKTDAGKQILRNKLGFAASMISGYGLSYAYNLDNLHEIELTGSVFGEGGNENGNDTRSYVVATLGGEFQRNFHVGRSSRFYGLIGGSYWSDRTTYNYSYQGPTNSNEDAITIGLAIGLEFTFSSRLLLNCEGGYLYRYTTKTGSFQNSTNSSYSLGFGVGCGIYYAF